MHKYLRYLIMLYLFVTMKTGLKKFKTEKQKPVSDFANLRLLRFSQLSRLFHSMYDKIFDQTHHL